MRALFHVSGRFKKLKVIIAYWALSRGCVYLMLIRLRLVKMVLEKENAVGKVNHKLSQ